MARLNLIIDFNNIVMRSMFRCVYTEVGLVSTFDTAAECGVLARKLTTDIVALIKMFMPSSVVLACDSKDPWRQNLYTDIPGEGYKGTRKKDESINFGKVFETADSLKKIYAQYGMVVTEIPHTEADDIAAMWTERKLEAGEDVVLVTSDKDWRQLVSYNGKNFCVCYNPIAVQKTTRLYATPEFVDVLDGKVEQVVDIFMHGKNASVGNVKDAILGHSLSVCAENPDAVLLEKVMCGDDSDNVPSIYEYYKSGKKVRVTPKRAAKICENAGGCSNVGQLLEHIDDNSLKEAISSVMKVSIDDIDMGERLERQRKLVELSSKLFPSEIVSAFSMQACGNDDTYVDYDNMSMDVILKNSVYLDENFKKRVRENDVFRDLHKMDKVFKSTKKGKLF